MKNILITITTLLITATSISQSFNEKTNYLIGTFHARNTTINGVSIGAFPNFNKQRFVKTNGLRLEIPGLGLIGFMGVGTRGTDIVDEIINGVNISTGTIGDLKFNGITIAGVSQSGVYNNGIAIAGFMNAMDYSNGIQISGWENIADTSNGIQIGGFNNANFMIGLQLGAGNDVVEKMIGLQIGLFNKSSKTKGIQIGLWNINEKRKLPIINWNFK